MNQYLRLMNGLKVLRGVLMKKKRFSKEEILSAFPFLSYVCYDGRWEELEKGGKDV
jgi:hypothetical protein